MRGFTLVELMITIAVAAILAVVAVPSFTRAIHRNQVSSASNALLADLGYARAEAITRGTYVSVCPSTDGKSCSDSDTWESGWLVYTYTAGNAVANKDYDDSADTNVLLRHTSVRNGVSVRGQSADVITFGPQGEMKPDGTTFALATCYRTGGSDESGDGHSTTSVPGNMLSLQASGNVVNTALSAMDSACVPAAPSSSP